MPPDGFKCKQCGNCCINLNGFSTCASDADMRRWEAAGRTDILEWVDMIEVGDQRIYDIWLDPRTDEDVSCCPWLYRLPGEERYICRIHDVKPDVCRDYPVSREHAEETGCPGFGG